MKVEGQTKIFNRMEENMKVMTLIPAMISIAFWVTISAAANDPTGNPKFLHPVIKGHGGAVYLPSSALRPSKGSKVIIDIASGEMEGGVFKGLDRAALILNEYARSEAGIDNDFKMAIILHGKATKAALTHEAYARHASSYMKDLGKTENPHLALVRQLSGAGVNVYVCGQNMAHFNYATTDIAPEVTMVDSAATASINLQTGGYAYIPFK